jgi:hypothetical protein
MSEHKSESEIEHLNFIEQIVEDDIRTGKHAGRVHTRFPPEPMDICISVIQKVFV